MDISGVSGRRIFFPCNSSGPGPRWTLPSCTYFEKELWFKLVNRMRRKQRSILQDHIKYIHNGIVKPFRVGIIQYTGRVYETHDLAKYLLPPSIEGQEYNTSDWYVRDK